MNKKYLYAFFLVALTVGLSGCGPKQAELLETQYDNVRKTFSDSVTNLYVDVYYESSAPPYVGNLSGGNTTWDITLTSMTDLFSNHPGRTVNVPTTLSSMRAIDSQTKQIWYPTDLIALGNKHAKQFVSGDQIHLSVFFLKGTFEGNAAILGKQLTGYPYAFVFKDVVVATGGDATTQKYVEQATTVHQLGHAIGLVNHGIPMAANHEDSFHQLHHTGGNCVMAFDVENKNTVVTSIAAMITGNQLGIFGGSSLADGQAFHP
jgi:hypothetical protein